MEAVANGGLSHPTAVNAAAPMQAEFQAQLDWDCDDLQTKGYLGLCLSPNLCTHIGATACNTWDSLNTQYRMPGWSVIFADYSAVSSIWISGSQDPSVEMERMHMLFACLMANRPAISDQLQGMILLKALPQK